MKKIIRTISCKVDEGKNLKHYVDFFKKENINIDEVYFLWDENDEFIIYGGSFNHDVLEYENEYEERILKEKKEILQRQINSLERSIELTEQKKLTLCEELEKLNKESK
jgi:hypothetical protein